ncbi:MULTISPECIES: GntR family transcriptional regulator [Actinomadura]|uniref:UTRA domain-containing protein n=1 Tax=Actinomadura litoris TaxID=2678616 RepID=A0A7K1LCL3_9ACTN|nr:MULTISPECIES: GntR family transcriptional regulator [Actinomadura]MBT2214094.1 GntR family transcriptional regulator [Actinomadura sp. NEAU-AAG7]MUN42161.1 UTRA domain-containing protein [Actinomadura litoris]
MIDPSGPLPKYLQLRAILVDLIEQNRLPVDAAVPSERELCRRFGVSRMTVRQAVDQLVAEDRLRRIPGKGTFVARPKVQMPKELVSFTEDMRSRGMRPGSVDLASRTVEADARLARFFGAAPGVSVHVLERLRLADGEPMAVERSHILASVAPGLFERRPPDTSLFDALERGYGIVMDAGEQTIEAGPAGAADARLLAIPPGATVFLLRQRTFSRGLCVEVALATYRADRYRIHLGLEPPRRPASGLR